MQRQNESRSTPDLDAVVVTEHPVHLVAHAGHGGTFSGTGAFSQVAVPEPPTFAIAAFGVASLFALAWRRRSR
jgi:MYXO-CTERM domain-containing protein